MKAFTERHDLKVLTHSKMADLFQDGRLMPRWPTYSKMADGLKDELADFFINAFMTNSFVSNRVYSQCHYVYCR